jgi:hypothetical protein
MTDHGKGKDPGKRHVFDDPRNVKRVIHALYVLCGVSVLAEFFVERHVEHPWEGAFGFYSVYGFVGIVVLVLLAKELRKIVMRKEDYYND